MLGCNWHWQSWSRVNTYNSWCQGLISSSFISIIHEWQLSSFICILVSLFNSILYLLIYLLSLVSFFGNLVVSNVICRFDTSVKSLIYLSLLCFINKVFLCSYVCASPLGSLHLSCVINRFDTSIKSLTYLLLICVINYVFCNNNLLLGRLLRDSSLLS